MMTGAFSRNVSKLFSDLKVGNFIQVQRCRGAREYGKVGNGNEMETRNGNWKLKTEIEMQPLSCCSHSNVVGS